MAPPVGTILSWHKDLAGTPALNDWWHECDGSLVTDVDSPYVGTNLPAIGNQYGLEAGPGTSGGTVNHGYAVGGHPFFQVIWIIRIK